MAEAAAIDSGAPAATAAAGDATQGQDAGASVLTGEPGKQPDTTTNADANKDQAKGTDKPDDKQADNKDAKQPAVPEKYELKLPEGATVDEPIMAEFTALGKEMGWSNEQAQKVADLYLKTVGGFAQKDQQAFVDTQQKFIDEMYDDPKFGGEKLDTNFAVARKVLDLQIPGVNADRLKADLDAGRVSGNHPDLVRIFHHIGQFIGPDKAIVGQPTFVGPKDMATAWYGDDGKGPAKSA